MCRPHKPENKKYRVKDFHGSWSGVYVMIDGHIKVIETRPDGPAQKSGIQPGDRLIRVDSQRLENKKLHEVARYLTGKAGSWVTLTIERDGRPRSLCVCNAQFIIAKTVFSLK